MSGEVIGPRLRLRTKRWWMPGEATRKEVARARVCGRWLPGERAWDVWRLQRKGRRGQYLTAREQFLHRVHRRSGRWDDLPF
jgi:hypothetical protein